MVPRPPDRPPRSISPASGLPVSVVIPAYDRAAMIAVALGSVAAQRPRGPAEVIVVDDASHDATAEVARGLGARVVRHAHNRGAAASRNTGIETATQPWIALLDSDDEWLPHHLEALWAARDRHVLVAASAVGRGAEGGPSRFQGAVEGRPAVLRSPAALVFPENFVPSSGAMVRRDVARAVGGYDTSLRYAEDLDLWLRVLEHGTGVVLPSVGYVYRRHAGQKSRDADGPRRAQLAIVRSAAGRPWWSAELVERRLAVYAWDDLRSALRARRFREVLRRTAWIFARPRRLGAVLRTWRRRRQKRRRGAAMDVHGPTSG